MDAFSHPQAHRDRSIVVRCAKCSHNLAKIEVLQVFKIGMYVCEACYKQLSNQPKTETLAFMNKDYLFTVKAGEIYIKLEDMNVQIPKYLIERLLKNE